MTLLRELGALGLELLQIVLAFLCLALQLTHRAARAAEGVVNRGYWRVVLAKRRLQGAPMVQPHDAAHGFGPTEVEGGPRVDEVEGAAPPPEDV